MIKKITAALILFFFSFSFINADTKSTTNYDDINFPQWTKDLRRTEIITFGSLPFVTLWTSVAYGLAVQGTFHNPLDKSTSNYTEQQQKEIIAIAASASLALGLTDLAINLISRKIKSNKQKKIQKTIMVIPFSQEEKEGPAPLPPEKEFQDRNESPETENPELDQDYFTGGMESAVF